MSLFRNSAIRAVLGAAVLLSVSACGPRHTLDPFDRVCFQPVKVAPEVAAAGVPTATAAAEVGRALEHYARAGALFKEVRTGCEAPTPTASTLVVEPELLEYAPDAGRPLSGLGGRARGNALVKLTMRRATGSIVADEEVHAFARSGIGTFRDAPDPAGGIDATAEGVGLSLHWWLVRNKANPGRALHDE